MGAKPGGGLRREKGLERRTPLKPGRKPLKRRVERDWTDARAKVEREGMCRVCGRVMALEAAHTIAREYDQPKAWPADRVEPLWVNPDSVIPLCGDFANGCHSSYDRHEIDVLHLLSLDEQLDAVKRAGGIELARVRTAPTAYTKGEGASE